MPPCRSVSPAGKSPIHNQAFAQGIGASEIFAGQACRHDQAVRAPQRSGGIATDHRHGQDLEQRRIGPTDILFVHTVAALQLSGFVEQPRARFDSRQVQLQERRRLEVGLGVVAVRRAGGRQEGHRQVCAIISVNNVVEAELAAHDQPGHQRGGDADGQADNGQKRGQPVGQQVAPGRDEDVQKHQRCLRNAEPGALSDK